MNLIKTKISFQKSMIDKINIQITDKREKKFVKFKTRNSYLELTNQ